MRINFVRCWFYLIHGSLGSPESTCTLQTASRSVQPFTRIPQQDSHCFWVGQTTIKIAIFLGGSGSHLIYGSLGPPESAPSGISIGSAVFARLTNVTNGQTDTHTDRHVHRPRYFVYSKRPPLMQCIRYGLTIAMYCRLATDTHDQLICFAGISYYCDFCRRMRWKVSLDFRNTFSTQANWTTVTKRYHALLSRRSFYFFVSFLLLACLQ